MDANQCDRAPMYYVIVENRSFGSLKAMCAFLKVPTDDLQLYVDNARFHDSNIVVVDKLVLGDPDDNMCAVVITTPGGAVLLCTGLFGELYPTMAEAEAAAQEFAQDGDFKGKFIGIGEFRPTAINRGMPQ